MSRRFQPGDNRESVDVLVHHDPLIRGLKAAKLFADTKDAGNSYSCVRLTPEDDRLIITSANALSMFITTAPLAEAAWSEAGVIDIPATEVPEIVSVYTGRREPQIDDQIRITAGEVKVRFVEASGFIDGVNHHWRRVAMEETAPDVPAAVDPIFAAEHAESVPPMSPTLLEVLVKASRVFGKCDVLVTATETHYLINLGGYARVVSIIPEMFRPGAQDDEDEGTDVDEAEDQEQTAEGTSDDVPDEDTPTEPDRPTFRVVRADPTPTGF